PSRRAPMRARPRMSPRHGTCDEPRIAMLRIASRRRPPIGRWTWRQSLVAHVVLVAACFPVAAPASAQTADDVACYHVRSRAPKTKYQVTLANEAGSVRCAVKARPKIACLATAEIDASPTPPGGGTPPAAAGSFLCYQLRCSEPLPPDTTLTDEFGGHALTVHGAQWYC